MVAELVVCACTEIMSGRDTISRKHAFQYIDQLYFVPPGRAELVRLGKPGGVLEQIAEKVFDA
jgi:hypothetical protein